MGEDCKYTLVGADGNAFSIIGYVAHAMKECKKSLEEQHEYIADATSGDYEHLLSVSLGMVDKLNSELDNR